MDGLGRYQLVRRIGAGGMAEIWKAKASGPKGFEKVLAIKRILPQHTSDEDFVDMFIEEAKLAAQLVHPNIVQVFDFGMSDKSDYFIAMEYVAGPNLAALIKRLRKSGAELPTEVGLFIAAEACKGLGHAHQARDGAGKPLAIIHRDVSPHNLLVSYGGELKITDFGIAKVADAATRTSEGQVRGKLSYMSPEQAKLRPLDHRSDLFSLGVVFYDLVTGEALFKGKNSQEIFAAVMNYDGLTPERLAKIPESVREILETTLQMERFNRYQSATQMEMAILSVLGTGGAVRARNALSHLVQKHFNQELQQETNTSADKPIGMVTKVSETSELRRVAAVQPITMGESVADLRPAPKRARGVTALIGVLALLVVALSGVLLKETLFPSATPTPAATVVAIATPVATATATPRATRRVKRTRKPTPKRTPKVTATATPKPVAAKATLVVKVRPWADVFVDGKNLGQAAPVGRYQVKTGKRSIRFTNSALGVDFTRSVTVRSGQTSLVVDMKKKTVKAE